MAEQVAVNHQVRGSNPRWGANDIYNIEKRRTHKMNTGRAKKIRKSVYGDTAHRPVKYVKDSKGTIRAVGLRRHYQEVKGAWND